MDNPPTTRVFLSYARGDDEPFVRRLHADLVRAGFTVWLDRESLLSRGLSFHQEIKDAIRTGVDRIVYVGGPQAALSAYVREEWKFGLECDHIVVTPILRLGSYEQIPDELSLLHCEDFRNDAVYPVALAKLVASLREKNPKLGALFAVPPLPPHFLGRLDLIGRVRNALLVDLQGAQITTGGDVCVGMQGMGGIGKSVLAAALARNRQIRQSYPDGIVWIAFGQNLTRDDILRRQRELARELDGSDDFRSPAEGLGRLRALLSTKAVLLVLDDVWSAGDAAAFNVLGPRCRMLVTTRDAGILKTLHGEMVPVSLFSAAEALQLLADAVGTEVALLPPEAKEVVDECGNLPLAVALCGGMASQRGGDFHSVLERLRHADLDKIADRAAINEQHQSIWRAMQASTDVLPPNERERFAELAVFETDHPIPEAAVAALWAHTGGLGHLDTEDLLVNLAERSLIQLEEYGSGTSPTPRRFSLHDLLHDYAVCIAGEPKKLHGRLVEAYRRQCTQGWNSLNDDGYSHTYLPVHLASGEFWDDLLQVWRSPAFACLTRWVERGETDMGVECLSPLVDYLYGSRLDLATGSSVACQLARIHTQRGEYAEAERRLQQAVRILPWWRDWRTRAIAYHELGSIRLYAGQREEASRLYRKALRITRLLGPKHRDEIAANLLALAVIHLELYQHGLAIRRAQSALPLALKALDIPHVVAAHRILAIAYKDTLNYAEAERHLQSAESISEAGALRIENMQAQIVKGWLYYARAVLDHRQIDAAVACFNQMATQARAMHHENILLESNLGLIWSHLFAQDVLAAQKVLNDILGVGNQSHHELKALVILASAKVAHEQGRENDAEPLYRSVAQWGQASGKRGVEADALVGLGSICWHAGKPGEAEQQWTIARNLAATCSPVRQNLVDHSIDESKTSRRSSPR